MLRVVCDTNIYISAILFGGKCETIIELARQHEINIYTSTPIILETLSVLGRKGMSKHNLEQVLIEISAFTILKNPRISLSIIKNPEADNRILECALSAKVDFLISGDNRLSISSFCKASALGPRHSALVSWPLFSWTIDYGLQIRSAHYSLPWALRR